MTRPTPAASTRLLTVALSLPLVLALSGCCGVCKDDPNPGETCDKMSKISKKPFRGEQRRACIRMVSEQFLSDDEAWSCFSGCIDDADDEEEGQACFKKCEAAGGVARLTIDKDTSTYKGGVVLTVNTKPGAKVTVELDPTKVSAKLPKKMKKRRRKAKKSGKAVFKYPALPKSRYNVDVTSKKDGDTKTKKTSFSIFSAPIGLAGGSSSGDNRSCTLKLDDGATVRPTKPIHASGGRASVVFSVAGGKTVSVGGDKARFKKGEARVTVNLDAGTDDLSAARALGKYVKSNLPVEIKAASGTFKGTLMCNVGSQAETLKRYKGGKLSFPGDRGRGDGSIIVGTFSPKIVGNNNAKLRDITYIAVMDYKTRKLRGCPYRANTGERFTLARKANDKVVTVYDRHSGKKVGKKKFRAPTPRCPRQVRSKGKVISEYPSSRKVNDWIKKVAR